MGEGNKTNFGQKIWRTCLRSPINVLAGVLLVYFGFLAFVLEKDAFLNKTIMLAVVFVWGVWFFLKNFIKIILFLAIIGCGAYAYYRYVNMDRINCEESGGVWNEASKTCEEKLSFWQEIQNKWLKLKKSAVVIKKATDNTTDDQNKKDTAQD